MAVSDAVIVSSSRRPREAGGGATFVALLWTGIPLTRSVWIMDMTYIPLNRDELLTQLVAFVKLSHECTMAPSKVGGSASRMGPIPPALHESPANTAGHESVFLSDAEAEAYNDLRHHLGFLRETEWLKTEDLDAKLWALACEIAIAPDSFQGDAARLTRAERFLSDVLRELVPYEVILTVYHIAPPPEPVAVWDARLLTATEAVLEPFVAHENPAYREQSMTPFLGHPALIVAVDGTAASPVIERARRLASHRLHVLRSSLATHWQTDPAQLLFTLGEHALARAVTVPPSGLLMWTLRPAAPIDLVIHSGHKERMDEMQNVFASLPHCHPSVRDAVGRAFEWIGRGLCRHWPGDALRDYATALEVLLVTSDKEQKSVLVPYRMLALAELHGNAMIHPTAVRHAYDRRSIVVHQGLAGAGDDESTRRMLAAARDCIGWLVSFAVTQPVEDHATLLKALDTPNVRAKAIAWLAPLTDPWSKKLLAGIQSLPR